METAMAQSIKYAVCSLDVWGNSEEGYDVNDVFKIGTIDLGEDMSDLEILTALVDTGFLDACATELGEVESCGDGFVHIRVKSDYEPILNLYMEQ
jgi:hypothetical protein